MRIQVLRAAALSGVACFLIYCGLEMASASPASPVTGLSTTDPTVPANPAVNIPGVILSCQGVGAGNATQQVTQAATSLLSSAITGELGKTADLDFPGEVNVMTACPKAGGGFPKQTPDCSKLSTKAALDSYLRAGKTELQALSCQQKKAEAVRGELTCLDMEVRRITQTISQLAQTYQQNLMSMNQTVTELNAQLADRSAQMARLGELLGGDPKGSGTKGLMEIQKELVPKLDQWEQQVVSSKQQWDMFQAQRESLNQRLEEYQASEAMKCFKSDPLPGYKCVVGGPDVSPFEYFKCQMEQKMRTEPNGRIVRRGVDLSLDKRVQGAVGTMDSAFKRFLFDLAPPEDYPLPKSPEEFNQSISTRNYRVISESDMLSAVRQSVSSAAQAGAGSNLQALNTSLPLLLKSCFKRAKVLRDRMEGPPLNAESRGGKNVDSPFRLLKRSIQQQEENFLAQNQNRTQNAARDWTQAMKTLTGKHFTLGSASCVALAPRNQIGCFEKITKEMRSLVDGTSQNALIDMRVEGARPQTGFNMKCFGIEGCITMTQGAIRDLRDFMTKRQEQKRQFIQASNQKVDQFTQQLVSQLNPIAQSLQARQAALNQALASMGLSGSITIPLLSGEELSKTEDGLYQMPKDLLNFVGGKTKPALMNLDGDAFAKAAREAGTSVKEVEEKRTEVLQVYRELAKEFKKCTSEALAKRVQSAGALLNKLPDACKQVVQACKKGGALEELERALVRLGSDISDSGIPALDLGVLTGAQPDLCKTIEDTKKNRCHPSHSGLSALLKAHSNELRDFASKEPDERVDYFKDSFLEKVACAGKCNIAQAGALGCDRHQKKSDCVAQASCTWSFENPGNSSTCSKGESTLKALEADCPKLLAQDEVPAQRCEALARGISKDLEGISKSAKDAGKVGDSL